MSSSALADSGGAVFKPTQGGCQIEAVISGNEPGQRTCLIGAGFAACQVRAHRGASVRMKPRQNPPTTTIT